MPYCVYKHTSPNGKVYIGITSQSPIRRWQSGGKGYKEQTLFWKAIQKYSWENFKHEIILEGLTKEQASELEKNLIKQYSSNDPKFGYNIDGGGLEGKIVIESTRQKMSQTRKGRPSTRKGIHLSAETIEKISASRRGKCVGKNNPMYGKKHTDEAKRKMRLANKSRNSSQQFRIVTEETRKKLSDSHKGQKAWNKGMLFKQSPEIIAKKVLAHQKRVVCVETGIVFPSIKSAGTAMNIDTSSITATCKGKRKSAGGYSWKYWDNDK